MRAVFGRVVNFSAFDLLGGLSLGNSASASDGSFPIGGVTYTVQSQMPLVGGSANASLNLYRFGDGPVGAIELMAGAGGTLRAYSLQGLSLSTSAVITAADTSGLADDRALLNQALAGNDTLVLSAGNDRAYGATGNDTIFGNRGNDVLSGNNGNDNLYGGDGADTLNGQANADRLFGGLGVDRISGGLNADTVTGGAGADFFVFTNTDGNDVIRDFQDNVDTIDINIVVPGTWQVDLQPLDGDTVLTIFRQGNPSEKLGLRIVIENINPNQLTDDILI